MTGCGRASGSEVSVRTCGGKTPRARRGGWRPFRLVAITLIDRAPAFFSGPNEVRIDRHDWQPTPQRLCGFPGVAFSDLDAAAGAPLRESAARSHRGPELRPRMAARL